MKTHAGRIKLTVNVLYKVNKKTFPIVVFIFFFALVFDIANADNKFLRAYSDIGSIETLIDLYKLDFEAYPSSLTDMIHKDKANIEGRDLRIDPWGSTYIYIHPAKYGTERYDLYSIGPNKVDEKGLGDDVSNWKGVSNIPKEKLRDIFMSKDEKIFFSGVSLIILFLLFAVIFRIMKKRKKI